MNRHRLLAAALAALLPACTTMSPARQQDAAPRTALILSIDGLSEARVRESLSPASVPALLALLDGGACAEGAVPAFPSLTAPGHAALWTGAYGDVSGIAGNWQPRLPRERHSLLDGVSGYFADGLRAEPIWITAARSGVAVAGHHVTQAPQAPHYPPVLSQQAGSDQLLRLENSALLERGGVLVVNGYNRMLAPDGVITEAVMTPRPAAGWQGLEKLDSRVAPREIAWSIGSGSDSLFALLHGGTTYDRALVARERAVSAGVPIVAVPVDTTPLAGRPLARHFSEPLHLTVAGSPVSLRFRLFELSAGGDTFQLFHTSAPRLDANHPELARAYVREIGGWIGNGSLSLLRGGAFGTPLSRGGDGTAEAHYLETAELMTLQYMRGLEWLARTVRPRLLIDYFPLADELDHEFLGMVDPAYPGYDQTIAERAQRVRERGWRLVDLRLEHARQLAEQMGDAALFVSGDHGMRTAWRVFRPNVALRQAELLEVRADGAIALERTLALSLNGYWISINGEQWKGGIVGDDERSRVLAAAEQALLAARDESGDPIVTAIWRSSDHPDLGIGGPAGGDLYFDVRAGYHMSPDLSGPVFSETRPEGKHGYPPMARDMHTVLCMASPAISARTIPVARIIDLAPTVAEWLDMPAPPHSRGRSLLHELLGEGTP